MQSSNETPTIFNIGNKFFDALLNQGLVFVVMGVIMWIMFNIIQENDKEAQQARKEDKEEIKELRQLVEDCALSKNDRIEMKVDDANVKLDEILKMQRQ